ncbi:trypsin-like serine protease [Aliikangiella maris]|uniref:Trypsin-like serine protease n=2 Tax=Aliikangiella maris TaxID=3162458 RepID=A0ABV3MSP8_9GAMM
MKKLICLLFSMFVLATQAVVKRHDISAESYALKSPPDFLIDMPHEGSAVLISPQWLLSAGHVIYYDGYEGKQISIQGVDNQIEKVIFHPDFKKQPEKAFTGDAKPLMNFLYGRIDLVLIKLSKPVKHLKPIARYYAHQEQGKITTTYGKGATGTGIIGEQIETKMHRPLNFFNNQIETVTKHHLTMRFEEPEKGLPLEGIHGSGDSGGPTIIEEHGKQYLIGIQSFRDYQGDLKNFKGGVYNSVSVLCRVSAFNSWIDEVIAGDG